MRFVPNAVSSTLARQVLRTQKHSPALLFAAGIVGVGTTVVLACKATLQVEDILNQHEKDVVDLRSRAVSGKETTALERRAQIDLALDLGKLYGPAILCGVTSVAALAGSQRILSKRNAGLAAAYGMLEKSYNEYRERVREQVGDDRERDIHYGLEACEIDDEDKPGKTKKVKKATTGGSQYARLFDSNNVNWEPAAELNFLFLKFKQNYMNQLLASRGHVFLNDVYDELGMERTPAGAVVGWVKDGKGSGGDGYIDFGIFEDQLSERVYDFMVGNEKAVWLDFNVDGVVYELI